MRHLRHPIVAEFEEHLASRAPANRVLRTVMSVEDREPLAEGLDGLRRQSPRNSTASPSSSDEFVSPMDIDDTMTEEEKKGRREPAGSLTVSDWIPRRIVSDGGVLDAGDAGSYHKATASGCSKSSIPNHQT